MAPPSPRRPLPNVLPIYDPSVASMAPEALVHALADVGAGWLQYRDKRASDRRFFERATALAARCEAAGIYLLINDRVATAAALGGCGVHLGQDDLPLAAARSLLPEEILGVSADSIADVAAAGPADYVAIGPVWGTGSKSDAGAAIGLEGVRAARAAATLPLVAIGGIGAQNAGEAIRAGADAVAVLSAIVAASDPGRAFREIDDAVAAARLTLP